MTKQSRRKYEVVISLVDALQKRSIEIWVDFKELQIGDNLRENFEEGLSKSKYGIVIISPSFLSKRWPRRDT